MEGLEPLPAEQQLMQQPGVQDAPQPEERLSGDMPLESEASELGPIPADKVPQIRALFAAMAQKNQELETNAVRLAAELDTMRRAGQAQAPPPADERAQQIARRREERAVVQAMYEQLKKQGRADEAYELMEQHMTNPVVERIPDLVNRAIEQRMAPLESMRAFRQNPDLAIFADVAPEAVAIQQGYGVPDHMIIDLLMKSRLRPFQAKHQERAGQWESVQRQAQNDVVETEDYRRFWKGMLGT